MLFTRERLEQIEDSALAPYGMRGRNSHGRVYAEDEHPSALSRLSWPQPVL